MRVISYINLFDFEQKIYVVNDEDEVALVRETSMDNLSNEIVNTCDLLKITRVSLCGPIQYAEEMAKNVYTIANTDFSNMNIEVEVIGL